MLTSSTLIISFSYLCYSQNMFLIERLHKYHVKNYQKSILDPLFYKWYIFVLECTFAHF